MCGSAQRDGRPLGGSVSPPSECYWLVNAQNTCPTPSRFWTKVYQITFVYAGVSVVCKRRFSIDDVLKVKATLSS